jgi:hypothetical protein
VEQNLVTGKREWWELIGKEKTWNWDEGNSWKIEAMLVRKWYPPERPSSKGKYKQNRNIKLIRISIIATKKIPKRKFCIKVEI